MKSRSRFAIVGTLLAVVLTLLYVLPTLARDSEFSTQHASGVALVVSVHAGDADPLSGSEPEDTRVGNVVYVAASEAAHNQVYVVVDGTGTGLDSSAQLGAEVSNQSTGRSLQVVDSAGADPRPTELELDNAGGQIWHGRFFVVGSAQAAVVGVPYLVAGDNQAIVVSSSGREADDGASYSITTDLLRVDATAPSISSVSPTSGGIQRDDSTVFAATFTDSGSGLRHDGEGFDEDGDGNTVSEPLSDGTGAAVDLAVFVGLGSADSPAVPGLNEIGLGANSWTTVANGYRVRFPFSDLTQGRGGSVYYALHATDRAGNLAIVGYDHRIAGANQTRNLRLTVDNTAPMISAAEAGIGFNTATNSEVADIRSIKLTFGNGGDSGDPDYLDSATVAVEDFRVEQSTASRAELPVDSVIHPNIALGAGAATNRAGTAIDTRNVVYLVLSDDIPANGRPNVHMVGRLSDVAGNEPQLHSVVATDKTTPVLEVSVAGDVQDRVAGREGVTIRVSSSEPLTAPPSVYLVTLADDDQDGQFEVATVTERRARAVSGASNTWEVAVQSDAQLANKVIGVRVTGMDQASPSNRGSTSGIAASGADSQPVVGDRVDLTRATLFELDSALASPQFNLTPEGAAGETQSLNPFIRIDFNESGEYPLDTHRAVTLTKLELHDGSGAATDLLGSVSSVDADSFVVNTRGLTVGSYTLAVNGTDDVGNALPSDARYSFNVVPRQPYSVSLSPGWNLISLPGEPANPDINAVLPPSHPAEQVLTYDPTHPSGPWLVATRGVDGSWTGTLTELTGTRAYWIQTGAFTPIRTLIPERDTATVLPTISVVAGWNLLPVVDLQQGRAGGPPGGGDAVSAASYFSSINWTVAYTFDTQSNAWEKLTKVGGNVVNGKGYWVWVTGSGTLVP